MPLLDGRLTASEREMITSKLDKDLRASPRPICGSAEWSVGNTVVTPATLEAAGGLRAGAPVFPQIYFYSRCGFVRYFLAEYVGLIF
jgi:hypothetical protein